MPFPAYVHSVIASSDDVAWPVQGQGVNECGITVAANALNLMVGRKAFDKDDLIHEAGVLFQRGLGGSPSPETARILKRHGIGTHFGNLLHTDAEGVLRSLIDMRVPVAVELGTNMVGPIKVYGQHSILLVGYSTPHPDRSGAMHEEYYFVDSQWPQLGQFDIHSNDVDVDGTPVPLPGNRTINRNEFMQMYQTRIYFPVFPSQDAHDRWYQQQMRPMVTTAALLQNVTSRFFTGSADVWENKQA